MTIRFYNSLTRKVEEFTPVRPGEVRLYSCGPTVYNFVHIGNLRAFAFVDLLKRYLSWRGFKVLHVMNITDVDDKTIRGAREAHQGFSEFTAHYTAAFIEDCRSLHILPPSIMPRATAEIEEMVRLISELLRKGHAYQTPEGDVYFRIASCEHYGELANLSKRDLKQNAEGRLNLVDEYSKENANDFALWKAWDPDDGEVAWDTPFGRGRPGWHIECSAMAVRHLGAPIDIHCGGIDLLFPHHTNEIAQSECGYGGKFVNLWMHNAHLLVNGRKMSKSLGNFYTLRDLLSRGYAPLAIRFELLKTHYRQELDFREENLRHHEGVLSKFSNILTTLDAATPGRGNGAAAQLIAAAAGEFRAALDDDLNISAALAVVHGAIGELSKIAPELSLPQLEDARKLVTGFSEVLGLFERQTAVTLPPDIAALVAEREGARARRDFKRADELRAQIEGLGYKLLDTPGGAKVTRG